MDSSEQYNAAGICYSCSIQCHGNHKLVELFCKRNFECDCGTIRLPKSSPCRLRINSKPDGINGSCYDKPSTTNKYNHNFLNRFCGCECDYDPENQKGTMYQCLGLGTADDGGCGEDWWHASCIVGIHPDCVENIIKEENVQISRNENQGSKISNIDQTRQEGKNVEDNCSEPLGLQTPIQYDDMGQPIPPGFPPEDSFEGFICYKCLDAFPWIKRYAGAPGFLPAVFRQGTTKKCVSKMGDQFQNSNFRKRNLNEVETLVADTPKRIVKRKKSHDSSEGGLSGNFDKLVEGSIDSKTSCKLEHLPPAQSGQFSLFFKEDFRLYLCRCDKCFPKLKAHPQLLELEETYEPSVSTDFCEEPESTVGSSSLYEQGESALQNIDRVKAIEGVMAYNHLKDKLKPFFQQFAESGRTISAEDIKSHFAKIRGDDEAIFEAGEAAKLSSNRHEQSGF